ncbi:MAG: MurR/RpiR family transcriptional regulator [Paracoccaceae bacterium]
MTEAAPRGTPRERLGACRNLSAAESAVATWFESHLHEVPFVSAANVAKGAGISEMTVIRFVRRLGYANFKTFKQSLNAELRDDSGHPATDRGRRFAIPEGTGDELDQQMQREVASVLSVYELARTAAWQAALDVVDKAALVNVTGFQASKGLALDFATRLKYARPGVRFAEGTSGNWSELFAESPDRSCLVLVDTAAYSQTTFRIAELCLRRDIPLVMITDKFSPWPRKYTPHVLAVDTDIGTFWDSTSALSALLGLFLNGVAARIGAPARARLKQMNDLGAHFDAYAYEPGSQSRPVRQRKDKRT